MVKNTRKAGKVETEVERVAIIVERVEMVESIRVRTAGRVEIAVKTAGRVEIVVRIVSERADRVSEMLGGNKRLPWGKQER